MKAGMQVLECLPICMKSLNSIPSEQGWCTPVICVWEMEIQNYEVGLRIAT